MKRFITLQLIRNGPEEGTLVVFLPVEKSVRNYFVEVFSVSRINLISGEIKERKQKYFFKKNLLIVYELSEESLLDVVRDLEETGDFFEIMRPLSWIKLIRIRWKTAFNKFNKNKF